MTVTRQTNFKHSPNFKKHQFFPMCCSLNGTVYESERKLLEQCKISKNNNA